METKRHEETPGKDDADRAKADAITDIEVSIETALYCGVSAREIRKIVKEVLDFNMSHDRNI